MAKINFSDVMDELSSPEEFAATKSSSGGSSVLGITITYNRNGKRLTITKALADKLDIGDTVMIAISPSNRLIIIGAEFEGGTTYSCSTTVGKPIIYNSALVEGVVCGMGLKTYFESHTSISYHEIQIDEENNVAFIKIPKLEG